jgi:2-polyprenyl-6-methoxyphenol hydroxylase-like FAD-dependent oxidoreductase
MNSNFDVIIVGSGPGGAFLGYLLDKKVLKLQY